MKHCSLSLSTKQTFSVTFWDSSIAWVEVSILSWLDKGYFVMG